jgi:hypothetical protein
MTVLIPVSWGELIDKITILSIKQERMLDPYQASSVAHELALLMAIYDRELPSLVNIEPLVEELAAVNRRLWDIEDALRMLEAKQTFDASFVALARLVYHENDRRSQLKRAIDNRLDSQILEEKIYPAY